MSPRDYFAHSPRRTSIYTLSRQAERSDETRNALTAAGRYLFAKRGYSAVSIEDVVIRARVTRGALYHHFKDKRDLFRAILEEVEAELVQEVVDALKEATDPWNSLTVGIRAFLDAATKPAALRIITIDGPAVLGWGEWREIDMRYGLGLVRAGIEGAMDAGLMKRAPVRPLSHVLLASLTESALLIADAKNRRSARVEAEAAIFAVLKGLRVS